MEIEKKSVLQKLLNMAGIRSHMMVFEKGDHKTYINNYISRNDMAKVREVIPELEFFIDDIVEACEIIELAYLKVNLR